MAFMPHNATQPLGMVLHGLGCSVPSTPGLAGGLPGATNAFRIVRGGTAYEALGRSSVPQTAEDLGGQLETAAGLYRTALETGDVIVGQNNGGGGLDDPLARDPEAVLRDITLGAVSLEWAERGYGVVVRDGAVAERETRTQRASRRAERVGKASLSADPGQCGHATAKIQPVDLATLGKGVFPYGDDGQFRGRLYICQDCGTLTDVVIERSSTSSATA
jgi:hypothetical protein